MFTGFAVFMLEAIAGFFSYLIRLPHNPKVHLYRTPVFLNIALKILTIKTSF
jgi:hypothetical protein